jgi:hypothetical protein
MVNAVPDQLQGLPVVEGEAGGRLDAEQVSAKDGLGAKVWLERLALLEVLKDLDSGGVFADGILRRVRGPDKLLAGPEGLVAQGHRGVDDVLAVAAHDHETGEMKK